VAPGPLMHRRKTYMNRVVQPRSELARTSAGDADAAVDYYSVMQCVVAGNPKTYRGQGFGPLE